METTAPSGSGQTAQSVCAFARSPWTSPGTRFVSARSRRASDSGRESLAQEILDRTSRFAETRVTMKRGRFRDAMSRARNGDCRPPERRGAGAQSERGSGRWSSGRWSSGRCMEKTPTSFPTIGCGEFQRVTDRTRCWLIGHRVQTEPFMRGSTYIPWLFFGPLFTALAAKIAYDFTGREFFASVALGALILTILVACVAFVSLRRALRRGGGSSSTQMRIVDGAMGSRGEDGSEEP
jgi:hypothetical protein